MSITCTRIDINRLPDVTAAQLLVADVNNRLAGVAMTGDIAISNAGVTAIGASKVLSAMLEESISRYAVVEITTAELLLLFTTPKVLVASPGANKVLEFVSLQLALDHNTIDYTTVGCGDLQVSYVGGAAVSVVQAAIGFINSGADAVRLLDKLEISVTPLAATALQLTLAGANPLAGNSPIHAKIAYRVYATGLT